MSTITLLLTAVPASIAVAACLLIAGDILFGDDPADPDEFNGENVADLSEYRRRRM